MTRPVELSNSSDPITARAADFLERRRFGEWNEADRAELEAWLAESTFHRVAYLRLEGAASYTEHLSAIHSFKIDAPLRAPAQDNDDKISYRRFAFPLLAAAAVVLGVVFEKPLVNYLMQAPESTYSTEIGGRTLLTFADHTQIELNTDTIVHFRITGEERTVWLDKGEAWFHVAHNAANPFTVIVGKRRITDLGTEFLIRRNFDHMEVALLTGRASLSADGTPTTTLTPGDDAVATPASVSVTRKSLRELADELAWRRGVLVFRNTKLSEVVREFNRYNQTKLVIADPSISDVKIYAELKTDDYTAFLNLAQTVLNLRVDREGNDILISRNHGDATKKAARAKRSL